MCRPASDAATVTTDHRRYIAFFGMAGLGQKHRESGKMSPQKKCVLRALTDSIYMGNLGGQAWREQPRWVSVSRVRGPGPIGRSRVKKKEEKGKKTANEKAPSY